MLYNGFLTDGGITGERFAKQFKAGEPEVFIETMMKLPQTDQAIVAWLARLLEMEQHLG